MLGILGFKQYRGIVEEFFQLFKTPWEFCRENVRYDVILADNTIIEIPDCKLCILYGNGQSPLDSKTGITVSDSKIESIYFDGFNLPFYCRSSVLSGGTALVNCQKTGKVVAAKSSDQLVVRVGYNLFAEVETLLINGQPLQFAATPSLDLHISILRNVILQAGLSLIEIPPFPYGSSFFCALTHDVDYIGIKRHFFDHSVVGFLYRALPGSILKCIKGSITIPVLLKNIKAAFSLPLVFLGLSRDFWYQFDWYIKTEGNYPSTYFLSPFKNRPGEHADSRMRAMRYQASDIPDTIKKLLAKGDEVGVHGIDSWHDVAKGKEELNQISALTGSEKKGIRMHWLYSSAQTPVILEKAGYDYDSTVGYNEMPGFKAGTFRPYVPPGCSKLLEIPMHVQDCAMLYSGRMNMTEKETLPLIERFINTCARMGGVLTFLWHQRSPGPERYWGDIYKKLISWTSDNKGYFATCSQIVQWFRLRRDIRFGTISLQGDKTCIELINFTKKSDPMMFIRSYKGNTIPVDIPITTDTVTANADELLHKTLME